MDVSAFEAFVARYQGVVCGVAYAVLGDRARSEEVAQEAFLLAWRRLLVQPVSAGWVCGVARNLARNAARRRREVVMEEEPIADARDACADLISREDAARAHTALAALPTDLREAVAVYYQGDESMEEVAAALAISRGAAKQRVHRGRMRLRESLASVELTLRARRPGRAFTLACVAAWHAMDAGTAAAATPVLVAPVLPAIAAKVVWAVGIVAVTGIAYASGPAPRVAGMPSPAGAGPVAAARTAPPASRGLATAASSASTQHAAPALAASRFATPFSMHWRNGNLHRLAAFLQTELDAPLRVAPELASVNVAFEVEDVPIIDVLDGALAQANAKRVEIPAIKLVQQGGRTDASTLGGDLITLALDDVSVLEAMQQIEAKLHIPIARASTPSQLPGPSDIDGELYIESWKNAVAPEYVPHVTLHVDNVTAGAALELLLEQTGLGYIESTGFSIVPR